MAESKEYREKIGNVLLEITDHVPEKRHWYMSLAVECVEKLNNLLDYDGITYPIKDIISCGLSCDVDGAW